MTIEFCPLADEVGNLAEWFAVGVGALAAVATTVVAFLAYKTSERAAGIAEEAKRIAEQQHLEAVKTREANARTIGRLLLHEVNALPGRIERLRKLLEGALDGHMAGAQRLLHAAGEISVPLLANAERVEDRIHNLPDLVGADLATMISHTRDLSDAGQRIKDAIVINRPTAIGTRTTYHYGGSPTQPELLLENLRFVETLAADFASEFRTFVIQAGSADGGPTH